MALVWTTIGRGLRCRCPACGEGRLFTGYLTVAPSCSNCGADNRVYPADDLPPYLTILIVGHIFAPIFMYVDRVWSPDFVLQAAIWLPLCAAACLALLPPMKGATVAICQVNDIVRERA